MLELTVMEVFSEGLQIHIARCYTYDENYWKFH